MIGVVPRSRGYGAGRVGGMAEAAVSVARRAAPAFEARRHSPRGLAPAARVHAPIRSAAFAVVALAMISVFSFPALGGAGAPPPSDCARRGAHARWHRRLRVRRRNETRSGSRRMPGTRPATCAPCSGNRMPSLETRRDDVRHMERRSSDRLQQGVALRISSRPGGGVRAITVTKNVYPFGSLGVQRSRVGHRLPTDRPTCQLQSRFGPVDQRGPRPAQAPAVATCAPGRSAAR